MAKINKVSERVKEAIKRKSAFGLPDRPSERGMKPEDIKRAFWQPVVDMSFSAIAEIDRVVDEINEAIDESSRAMTSHTENKDNPHKVTKDQVGLGKVNNTADAEKPVSAAQREAIAEAKEQFSNELQTEKSRATLEEGRLGDQITQETERAQAAEVAEQKRAEGVESGLDARVKTIEGEIPTDASVDNKLATQSFTNSSINNLAAFYITYNADNASFPSKAALTGATTFYNDKKPRVPTTNDYAIVRADESQPKGVDGSYPTTRYVYQGGTYPAGSWSFQWVINNTSLTQAQIDALNSGITAAGVAQIEKNKQIAQNAIPKSEKGVAGGVATLDGSGQVSNSNLNNAWLLQGGTEIPQNADLDDYTIIGNYWCPNDSIVQTMKNCPTKTAFFLKVYEADYTAAKMQLLCVIGDGSGQLYSRRVGYQATSWQKTTSSPNEFVRRDGGDWRAKEFGNQLFVLPQVSYDRLSITVPNDYSAYYKELLKYVCKNFPNVAYGCWIGSSAPGSAGYCVVHIYNTSDVNDEGLPHYADGQFCAIDGTFHVFGSNGYSYYYRNYGSSFVNKAGDTMTGELSSPYLSSGDGYGKSAGKNGVKVSSYDGVSGIAGLGEDITDDPFDVSLIGLRYNGKGLITFNFHNGYSDDYKRVGRVDENGNADFLGHITENGQRVYSPNNPPNRAQTENNNEFNPFYNNASPNKYAWFNYRGSGMQAEEVRLGDGGGEGRYGVWKAKDYLFSDGVSVLEKVDQKINEAITTALNTAV